MKINRSNEINTGSTADIAFLLLVFFLLVTTMETEEGIAREMPEKDKVQVQIEINERDVLEVYLNGADQLLVDEKLITPEELPAIIRSFLSNTENRPEFASMEWVTEEKCRSMLSTPDVKGEKKT